MHLPALPLPGLLDPLYPPRPDPEQVDIIALDTIQFGTDQFQAIWPGSAVGVQVNDRMAIWYFVRMLAKIAHGYHVATRGMFPLEESPLIPIILGTRRDARNWIGCNAEHPLPSDRPALHLLSEAALEDDDQSECGAVRAGTGLAAAMKPESFLREPLLWPPLRPGRRLAYNAGKAAA